jgi:transposase
MRFVCELHLDEENGPMNQITTVAIDLAKQVFQLHGTDAQGQALLRRQVRRAQLPAVLA